MTSKQNLLADENYESNENNVVFSKRVENTVGIREIASYERFLLFPTCLWKIYTANT